MLQVHLVNIYTKGSLLSTPVLSDSYSLETLRHIVEFSNCVILQCEFVQIGQWSFSTIGLMIIIIVFIEFHQMFKIILL